MNGIVNFVYSIILNIVIEKTKFDKWFKQLESEKSNNLKKVYTTKDEKEAKELTYEEFKAGVPGYVWLDQITSKLIFKGK